MPLSFQPHPPTSEKRYGRDTNILDLRSTCVTVLQALWKSFEVWYFCSGRRSHTPPRPPHPEYIQHPGTPHPYRLSQSATWLTWLSVRLHFHPLHVP